MQANHSLHRATAKAFSTPVEPRDARSVWTGVLEFSSPNVTYMASIVGDNDDVRIMDRLYSVAELQSGYLTAQQAIEAGVARSTLTYHAREGGTLRRASRAVYRLRRFPSSPHEHVVPVWLGLSRADAVVSNVSALELLDLADVIPDEVHVTMPREKRGTKIPEGVRAHFTDRPISGRDRRLVLGVPVTGVERTITDVVRGDGWTEQVDLAVRQSLVRGMTTLPRLREQLPKSWQARLRAAAVKASS
jgi:predicted transcriptional regulator of viral defense system